MRPPRVRFTVRRMMVAVAASAVVSALLAVSGVPPNPGFAYGTAGCLAIVGIASLATDNRDLWSALAAAACGILVGALLLDPCTLTGIFVGPIVGYIARITIRRLFRDTLCDPNPALIPVVSANTGRPAAASLRDDYVGPRIDTAPRLWDRELDG